MTTNNDSFGGKNLFDYFDGSFNSPLESQSKDTESTDDKKVTIKVSQLF